MKNLPEPKNILHKCDLQHMWQSPCLGRKLWNYCLMLRLVVQEGRAKFTRCLLRYCLIWLAVKRVRSCATIEAALKIVTQNILGKLQKAICVSLRHISMHKPFKFQEGVLNPSISADGPLIMIISDMLTAQLYLILWYVGKNRPSVSCKSDFWNLEKCQMQG